MLTAAVLLEYNPALLREPSSSWATQFLGKKKVSLIEKNINKLSMDEQLDVWKFPAAALP